jgi:hypothetical protein
MLDTIRDRRSCLELLGESSAAAGSNGMGRVGGRAPGGHSAVGLLAAVADQRNLPRLITESPQV